MDYEALSTDGHPFYIIDRCDKTSVDQKKNVDKKCHSSSTRNLNMLYSVKYVSPYKAAINISFSFWEFFFMLYVQDISIVNISNCCHPFFYTTMDRHISAEWSHHRFVFMYDLVSKSKIWKWILTVKVISVMKIYDFYLFR